MPGALEDFLQRFGSGQNVDHQEAHQYLDRFASSHENDQEFDNHALSQGASEYLGQLPDEHFHQAAYNAYQQSPPPQRRGLIGSLLGALQGQGANLPAIGNTLGLGSLDPNQMSADDYAKLANHARREYPEAIQQTVRQQPGFLKALGNPIVAGALALVASKYLHRQPAGV